MTNPLPQPPLGRNPPRYRMLPSPSWRTLCITGAVVASFLIAGGIYYVFNVNPVPTNTSAGQMTIGQGAGPQAR